MERMAKLPSDMVFFTQITMEAAEDPEFLKAMKAARIRGVLVGVEAVTRKASRMSTRTSMRSAKLWSSSCKKFRQHGVYVLRVLHLRPSQRPPGNFPGNSRSCESRRACFCPVRDPDSLPGNGGLPPMGKERRRWRAKNRGVPITRRWLIPPPLRPKIYWPHPVMSAEEIRERTQAVWDEFYSWGSIWKRSNFIRSKGGRLAFLLISRIYRHMYSDTGIATDSARVAWSTRWTRILAKPCQLLFAGQPMPDLAIPDCEPISIRPSHLAENAS